MFTSSSFFAMDLTSSRQENLDRLFDDFSPWDILYLRKKILNVIITLAGLHDLPAELICLILANLDFDDYLSCTLVSRKWNTIWGQEEVITQVLHQFFPGLQMAYPETSPQNLYSAQLQLHLKWRQPHSNFTWIPWNLDSCDFFIDLPEVAGTGAKAVDVPGPFFYNKGKFAWQASPRTFIVDDPRTRQRLRFMPPGSAMTGERYGIAAISDQLLVLIENDRHANFRTVHIANLATREWKVLTLPSTLMHACVDSNTVYFVAYTAPFLRFTWGGKLIDLGLHEEVRPVFSAFDERAHKSTPRVLLHPTNENIMFIGVALSHRAGDKRLFSFLMLKFEDDHFVGHKSTSIRSPMQNPSKDCQHLCGAKMYRAFRKSDNHGTFALGIYRYETIDSEFNGQLCDCCEPRRPMKGDWGAVTFNVLTEKFDHHEYLTSQPELRWAGRADPRGDEVRVEDAHLWNDSLLLATSKRFHDGESEHEETYIETMHPIGSHQASSPRWAPIRHTERAQEYRNMVFQDDDYVLVPSLGGMAIYEPSSSPSAPDVVIDDTKSTGRLDQEVHPLCVGFKELSNIILVDHETWTDEFRSTLSFVINNTF